MSSSVAKNKEKSVFSKYSRLRNVVRSKAVQSISKSAFADCEIFVSELLLYSRSLVEAELFSGC